MRVLIRYLTVAIVFASFASGRGYAKAPAGRYVISDQTVYDTKTKLNWQRIVPADSFTQADAKAYCRALSATIPDLPWRLPTLREMLTIIDYSATTAPLVDTDAFPGTPSAAFWSSTLAAGAASMGYITYTNFAAGATLADITTLNSVRCVSVR